MSIASARLRPVETRGWPSSTLAAGGVLAAAYYFLAFLYIALQRVGYPFSLEWMEGESLIQVSRLLSGAPAYAPPSYEYVSSIYTPLYYYVSALSAKVLGLDMLPLRLVSLVCSLGCMMLIYLICRREAVSVVPALLASGFFAATYELSGTWFDIGRVDMLAIALMLCSIYLLSIETKPSALAAGLTMALACLTKQTNLFLILVLCIYLLLLSRRLLPWFAVAAFGAMGLASLVLDAIYSGWYSFFVFHLAFGSEGAPALTVPRVLDSIPAVGLHALLQPLPIIVLLIALYMLAVAGFGLQTGQRTGSGLPAMRITRRALTADAIRRPLLYLTAAAGMTGISWVSSAHVGGFKNNLIPMYAMMAVLLGLSLHRLGYTAGPGSYRRNLLLFACILQLAILYYPIGPQIPTRADALAGEALVTRLKEQQGQVYLPFHPELGLRAGKKTYASWDNLAQLEGLYGGGDVQESKRVKAQFVRAMAGREFSLIILDKDFNWVWGHPEAYYVLQSEPVFAAPDVFWPVTGFRVRPTWVMLPKAQ